MAMLAGPALPGLLIGAFFVAVLAAVLIHKAVHKVWNRNP